MHDNMQVMIVIMAMTNYNVIEHNNKIHKYLLIAIGKRQKIDVFSH